MHDFSPIVENGWETENPDTFATGLPEDISVESLDSAAVHHQSLSGNPGRHRRCEEENSLRYIGYFSKTMNRGVGKHPRLYYVFPTLQAPRLFSTGPPFVDGSVQLINLPGHCAELSAVKITGKDGRYVLLDADGPCGLTITLTVQIANRIRARVDMQS